ncbi:MAG: phosphoenolpyruvate-utilizing N-terminal domain-containing protein, partial [Bacteroidota bacterium]
METKLNKPANIIEAAIMPFMKVDEKTAAKGRMILKGIPSSAGIAMGKASVLTPENYISQSEDVPQEQIPRELTRYKEALDTLQKEFRTILNKIGKKSANISAI